MSIAEAAAAIVDAHPKAIPSRVKTAFRKLLKKGLDIDDAKVKIERYAAAGEYDHQPQPTWAYIGHADPTGEEVIARAAQDLEWKIANPIGSKATKGRKMSAGEIAEADRLAEERAKFWRTT